MHDFIPDAWRHVDNATISIASIAHVIIKYWEEYEYFLGFSLLYVTQLNCTGHVNDEQISEMYISTTKALWHKRLQQVS